MKIAAGMVLSAIVYLILLTWIGLPRHDAIESTVSNQTTYNIRCAFEYTEFHTALFVVEAVVMLAGARLCWAVKDVPDAVNESKVIAIGKFSLPSF